MKLKSLVLITFIFINTLLIAQVGIGTVNPEASSILEVKSTTKGFLLPRVSEHTVVIDPAIGLMVYDLNDHCINIFLGNDTWKNLCESTPGGGGGGTGIIIVPPTDPIGEVNISTKICFDVAETNDAPDGCGALEMRTPIEADFTDVATHTQTLTISSSTAIDNIVVSAHDPSGKVILNANPPLVDNLGVDGSTTATIEYKQDLNTEATGLDHANRLTATIYVNYDEAGVAKQVQISPFVKDCACSQIESTNGEQHMFINDLGELYSGNTPFYNWSYSLGHSDFTKYEKVPIPNNIKIIDVTYGEYGAIALGENGTPYIFGAEQNKSFGNSNSFTTQSAPVALNDYISGTSVAINEPVIDVAIGYIHSVYLTQSLKIYIAGGPYGAGRSFGSAGANTGFPLAEVSLPAGSGSPIAIHADRDNTWVIDDNGDAYATGRAYNDAFGFNADHFSGGYEGQQTFKKLQLGPNTPLANGSGISPSTDFPSPIIDLSGTSRATAVLLENGDIYYSGENTHIATSPVRQSSITINATYTSVFGKLLIDGDATSMGQPVDIHVFSNWETYSGGFETSSIIYILDDKGDLYAKGAVGGPTPVGMLGGWGSNLVQATFKKIDLTVMGTEKIVNIKTNFGTTMLVSDAGKLYYTGMSGGVISTSTAIENTFKAADKAPASNTNWVK